MVGWQVVSGSETEPETETDQGSTKTEEVELIWLHLSVGQSIQLNALKSSTARWLITKQWLRTMLLFGMIYDQNYIRRMFGLDAWKNLYLRILQRKFNGKCHEDNLNG